MNIAFIIQGVLLLLGTVLSAAAWSRDGRRRPWQAMVGIAGISWIIVGLIPEDVNLTGHSIGALPVFLVGNLALIILGLSRSTQNRPTVRRSGLVLGVVGLLGFALTICAIANPTGPIGIGFAERITVFPLRI
jgi:hypothetical membrane protein